MKRLRTASAGFTIPELLVVLGLVAVLLIIGFVVLKPQNFDATNRNAGRMVDTAFIVQTLDKYYAKKGSFPTSIPTEETVIGTEEGNYDLCKDLVPEFVKDVPFDPQNGLKIDAQKPCNAKGQRYVSSYTIARSTDGKTITVGAPFAEDNELIRIVKTYQ